MILGNDHLNLLAKSSVSPAYYNVALIWCAAEVTTGCALFSEWLKMKRSACVILATLLL